MPINVSKKFDEKVVSTPEKLSLFVKRDMNIFDLDGARNFVVPSMNQSYI